MEDSIYVLILFKFMKPDNSINEYDTKYEEILKELGKTMLHNILVSNDLVDLYLKNPSQAIVKIEELIDIDKYSDSFYNEYVWIVDDFIDIKERVTKKLNLLDEDQFDKDELLMILFYAVSSFESMVNLFLFCELDLKGFSKTEIKDILRIDMDDKLGWLLKLICGFKYTENKNWTLLSRFVKTRNFFIHFKPVTWAQEDMRISLLDKESISEFIDVAYECYLFLIDHHSEKYKENIKKFEQLKEFELNFKKV